MVLADEGSTTREKVVMALTDGDVSTEITDDALFIMISAVGDSPLGPIQSSSTAKEAWKGCS